MVTITDLNNVLVDGVNVGSFTAAARNKAAPLGDLQTALEQWAKSQADGIKAQAAAVFDTFKADRAAGIDELQLKITELQNDKLVLQGKIDKAQEYIDALGGTEEGRRLARLAKREALEKQREEIDKEILELATTPEEVTDAPQS